MNIEELKIELSKTNAISLGKSKQPEKVALVNTLFQFTNWCPKDFSIATRIFIINNDITELPACPCGEDCIPNKLNHKLGFTEFCSPECSKKYKRTPRELMDKEWMYTKRVVERFSAIKIASILGVSDVAVGKWLHTHGLATEKYNWSESATQEDKDSRDETRVRTQLGDLYSTLYETDIIKEMFYGQGLSISKISETFSVSISAIRRAAEFRGVELPDRQYSFQKSAGELELYEYVKAICPTAISGFRFDGHKSPEMDIYIPELKLGIDYHGCYAHSEARRDNDYHFKKSKTLTEAGFRYIQIWEDDINNHPERTKNFIKNLLNPNHKIGARETIAKEISQKEFSDFLETNHLQGGCIASIRLGCFYEGELKSVMGFKQIASNVRHDGYDLVRYANTDVIGAFGKLLAEFRKTHKEDVYSYANLETVSSVSNVYTKNGFIEKSFYKPTYSYYSQKTKTRHHKFNYRKEFFKSVGIDISGKTEHELALEYGLLRCYDSGKILYVHSTKQ
jgi:very-short-patch-repair endonuclease